MIQPPPAAPTPMVVPPATAARPAAPPAAPSPAPPAAPAPQPPIAAAPPPVAVPPARPAAPSPKEFAETPALKDVYFDFDKYDIRPGDAKSLDANADWLKSNPATLILIEGHCDERGTNAYNLALGERRARTTRDYLVAQGVGANRITIISYGEERPSCTMHSEECWQKNRRAHFLTKPM
jgi:peptidoglycan-associated lipoprotein